MSLKQATRISTESEADVLGRVLRASERIEQLRAGIHVVALERSELIRELRQTMSLAEIGRALGISGAAVAKLQRRR